MMKQKSTLSSEQKVVAFREQKMLQQRQKAQLNTLLTVRELVDQVHTPSGPRSEYSTGINVAAVTRSGPVAYTRQTRVLQFGSDVSQETSAS